MPSSFRETLEGLKKVGYKLNDGYDGAGHLTLALAKAGGYYLGACRLSRCDQNSRTHRTPPTLPIADTGACQDIIDGKIKIKSGTEIERYTAHGLRFKDGTELAADVVVFATG